jgi:hypothetical protein
MSSSTGVTKQKNTLRKLLPEIRYMIFKLTLAEWKGKTPVLIKALRGDQEMYFEALAVFYRINTFTSSYRNRWGDDMSDEALHTVVKWKIELK